MFYYIYRITNNINGKTYLGCHQTMNLDDNYLGSGTILARAKNYHGKENFTKEILWFCESRTGMFELERILVTEEFVSLSSNYNVVPGGRGRPLLSEESKKRISEKQKGKDRKWITDGIHNKLVNKLQDLPTGWYAGRTMKEEDLERWTACGRNFTSHTVETTKKISFKMKGKKKTEEHRKNISKSRLGKKTSPRTQTTKQKMRESAKLYNPGFSATAVCPQCKKEGQKANISRHHGLLGEKCSRLSL